MFDSQLLMGGSVIFSPWFPRGADSARMTLDVTAISTGGSPQITVEVFTKNSEDAGDGENSSAVTGDNIIRTLVGRTTHEWDSEVLIKVMPIANLGLRELVRYKYTIADIDSDWVLFRMLDPVWYDAVR